MNAVYNETYNSLKWSRKDFMKTSVTENEYSKLENNQPLKENSDFID